MDNNIALCISGLADSYKDGIDTLKTLDKWRSKGINIDTYIHTWESSLAEEYINLYKPVDYIIDSQQVLDPVINFFAKKHIKFRDALSADFVNKIKTTNYTCLSQFYSMRESHLLRKKTNRVYDFVIRSRCDIVLKDFISNIDYVLTKLSKYDTHNKRNCTNILFVPWIRSDERGNTHTDWCVMLARPYVFDIVFDLFPLCLNKVPKLDGSEHSIIYEHMISRNVRVHGNIPLKFSFR